ncbi:MAG: PIN domain-containing protein [Nitrososphaera sp.]|nr:PIN domain-containing protein [Nitrososphaera sp.]
MPPSTVLIDTNVLWKPSLRNQLTEKIKSGVLRVYVPTLIHAERIRQIADEKGDAFAIDVIRQLVDASGIELLPFTTEDAEAIADVWHYLKAKGATENDWRQHRFDLFLCAIAQSRGYTLITDDKGQHFEVITSRMSLTDLQKWLKQI